MDSDDKSYQHQPNQTPLPFQLTQPQVINEHYATYSQNRNSAVSQNSYFPPQIYEPLAQPSLHQQNNNFLAPPNPYQQSQHNNINVSQQQLQHSQINGSQNMSYQQQPAQISPFLLSQLSQNQNNNISNPYFNSQNGINQQQQYHSHQQPQQNQNNVNMMKSDEEKCLLPNQNNNDISNYPYHNQHHFSTAPVIFNNPYQHQQDNSQKQQFVKKVTADYSIHMKCAYCGQDGPTKVKTYNGAASWGSCLLLFCCGFYVCSCIPLCAPCCKDAEHRCSRCDKLIAAKRAFI